MDFNRDCTIEIWCSIRKSLWKVDREGGTGKDWIGLDGMGLGVLVCIWWDGVEISGSFCVGSWFGSYSLH